jgi:hypothetical protein
MTKYKAIRYLLFPLIVILLVAFYAFIPPGRTITHALGHACFVVYYGMGLIIFVYSLIINNELYATISGIMLSTLFVAMSMVYDPGSWYSLALRCLLLFVGPFEAIYASAVISKIDGKITVWWRHLVAPLILCCFWYIIVFILVLPQ